MKRGYERRAAWRRIGWVVLSIAVLIQCGNSVATTNPVQSIDVDGFDKKLTDETFNGLVVAMASWCPPCREELPQLAKLYQKYQQQGIDIVAFSIDADGPKVVQPMIDELRISFPVYWVGTQAIQKYKLVGIPTLLVIQEGKIIEKLPGLHPKRVLENKIKKLLP